MSSKVAKLGNFGNIPKELQEINSVIFTNRITYKHYLSRRHPCATIPIYSRIISMESFQNSQTFLRFNNQISLPTSDTKWTGFVWWWWFKMMLHRPQNCWLLPRCKMSDFFTLFADSNCIILTLQQNPIQYLKV